MQIDLLQLIEFGNLVFPDIEIGKPRQIGERRVDAFEFIVPD
jgi:hypothetical protein